MKEKETQNKILLDLRRVGPLKPLGCLPLNTIEIVCQIHHQKMQQELEERDIRTKLFTEEECNVWSGALYAYDEAALRKLLVNNIQTLKDANWSLEPNQFVEMVASKTAEQNTPLFRLIADAFADYTNPLRTRKIVRTNLHP